MVGDGTGKAMVDPATFPMSLTDFQQLVLARIAESAMCDPLGPPTVTQVPYVHPQPGAANQYLVAAWGPKLRIYIYDDEIGFDEFTLEREDFATDEAQLLGMAEEMKRLRANGS